MPSQQSQIEDSLAREMAKLKIQDERKRKEVERICAQSDELKELQKRITAAYQNKERAAQITEKQYRQQVQLVSLFGLTLMKLLHLPSVGARHSNRQDHAAHHRNPRLDSARGRRDPQARSSPEQIPSSGID